MKVVAYKVVTGEIINTYDTPKFERPADTEIELTGIYYIEDAEAEGDTAYVNEGVITPRPLMSLEATTTEGNTVVVTGVPKGTEVRISGDTEVYTVDDSEVIEIEFTYVGSYTLTFSNFPYVAESVEVLISQ